VNPVRTLIVDDEPLARENLRIRLSGIPDFTVVGECNNGREALTAIGERRPDLLFIDIRMPDLDGFEVIEQIHPDYLPVIVFVTAYDRYALEAFRVHALDYLLKPFDDERFADTLQLVRERIQEARRTDQAGEPLYRLSDPATPPGTPWPWTQARRGADEGPAPDRLVIKTRGRVFFLKTANIDWIEGAGDYARLHVGPKSYLIRKTMQEIESRLGPADFVRVSRSTIVSLDRIKELVPASRGEFVIRLQDGQEVKLTRNYREKLEARLGDQL
jgi:two-component system LytT family response regulator